MAEIVDTVHTHTHTHTHGYILKEVKRENNLDLLRIISCIAVVCIHVSQIWKDEITDYMSNLDTNHVLFVIVYNTLTRFAVPCFIMLSGALLLSNNKNKNYKEFYKKTFKRIVIPTILATILYFMYNCGINIIRILLKQQNPSLILEIIKLLVKGKIQGHLWYLYMIIGIYLLTPIVILFKESISEKRFAKISWIFLFFACISGWTSTNLLSYDIGSIFEYLGYFCVGYEIKKYFDIRKNNKKGICFIMIGILVELLIVPIQYNHSLKGISESMEKYSLILSWNPLIVTASILIFAGFCSITVRKEFSKLASYTFDIYIFHNLIRDLLLKFCKSIGIITKNTDSRIAIVLMVIVVFMISYIVSIIWAKIWNRINRNKRVDKLVDKLFDKI
jgi:surface polysaccharide O-acyltransferase-like enzyme